MQTIQSIATNLTTLDMFLIACTVIVLFVGAYLVFTLKKINHITKVVDDIATVVENLTKSLNILEKIPLDSIQKVVDKIPGKGNKNSQAKKK